MKDRMALSMIRRLEEQHSLKPGARIVESSSGNTATALSMLCADRGYEFVAVMDGHAAKDKVRAVRALGGSAHLVPSNRDALSTALRDQTAHTMAAEGLNTHWTAQHDNPANAAGYADLARELIDDLGDRMDVFISAIGTGGSLCGTARELKKRIPNLKTIGVEPHGSVIFGWPAHEYLQSGTGTPEGANVGIVIDYDVIDEGRKVGDAEAFATCRVLARCYGLLVGGSAGGAIFEAIKYATQSSAGTRIVVLGCDTGFKYLDTIYDDDWLRSHNIATSLLEEEILHLLAEWPSDLRRSRERSAVGA